MNSLSQYWKHKIKEFFYCNKGYLLNCPGKKFYWQELFLRIREFHSFLKQSHINRGEIVSIDVKEIDNFLVVFFGCLYHGITPLLLPSENFPIWANQYKKILTKNDRIILGINPPPLKVCEHSSSFFLFTSGTSNDRKCIGISSENLNAVFRTHIPHLHFREGLALSTLPFTHIFGLVLDLFLSLEFKKSIVRAEIGGITRILPSLKNDKFSISGVPFLFQRLKEAGFSLHNMVGGIVGGAPISQVLSDYLKNSKIQVGYGQTEASPGILLGKPGEFFGGYIGREIGLQVSRDLNGQLSFKGENGFTESLDEEGIHRHLPERWIETGDIVEKEGDLYFYRGRIVNTFKLSNGKMFSPENLETWFFDEFQIEILLFPLGSEIILLADRDERIVQNLLPAFLKQEKIKIYYVSNWSKDRKGNISRKTMVEHFIQNKNL